MNQSDKKAEKIKEVKYLFDKNMLYFKYYHMSFFNKFHNYVCDKLELGVSNDDSLEIYYNNLKIYAKNPKQVAIEQAQAFMENPYEVKFPPSKYVEIDTLFHSSINRLYDLSPNKDKNFTTINMIQITKTIPILIIIGMGCGYHIEYLLNNLDIRHLIIVEPDANFFYLSLHTVEWEKIFNYFKKDGRTLDIHLENVSINNLISNIRLLNPVFVNHSLIYKHFQRDNVLFNSLIENIFLLTRGFGFYDDEKWSLEHTIGNIKDKVSVYSPKNKVPRDAVAFIVGAGPSLDECIDVIKKYKDKAIIFSCGSAIRTFEREGIKPDFHVEIERTYDTYNALNHIDRDYLKEIPFLGNNTVHPEVYSMFNEKSMFLKANDAGADLFPKDIVNLYYCNPTVTNGALSLIASLGFKNVYLFGADVGFKDLEKHHSKYNIAMDKESSFYCDQIKEMTKEVPGNFCEKIHSTSTLLWAKNSIEELIGLNKDIKVYNCSDGGKIDRTRPMPPNELKLDETGLIKEEIVKTIKDQFNNDYLNDLDNITNNFKVFSGQIEGLLEMIANPVFEREEIIDLFFKMYQFVSGNNLIRGSVLHFQNVIYSHFFVDPDKGRAIAHMNIGFDLFRGFLLEVKKELAIMYTVLESFRLDAANNKSI